MYLLLLLAVSVSAIVQYAGARRTHQSPRNHQCWARKFGGRPIDNYGAWTLCADLLPDDAIVWSFGVGGDISFELEVERFIERSTVRSFDPTISSAAFTALCAKSIDVRCPVFQPIGLAPETGVLRLYRSLNPLIGSLASVPAAGYDPQPAIVANVSSLADLLVEYGVGHLDVLKIDVEGAEFDLVESWDELPVTQLAIELHDRFYSDGAARRVALKKRLATLGFHQVHATADELLFLKQ